MAGEPNQPLRADLVAIVVRQVLARLQLCPDLLYLVHVAMYDIVDADTSIVCIDASRVLRRGKVRGSVAGTSSPVLLNIVLIWLRAVHVVLRRTVVQDGQIIEEYLIVVAVGGTWRRYAYLPLRVVGRH